MLKGPTPTPLAERMITSNPLKAPRIHSSFLHQASPFEMVTMEMEATQDRQDKAPFRAVRGLNPTLCPIS